MDPIIESGMTFGPYPEGHCFPIEDSRIHKAAGDGVKIVEFLKLKLTAGKAAQVWLVEAKKSAPKAVRGEYESLIAKIRKEGKPITIPVTCRPRPRRWPSRSWGGVPVKIGW